jgi:hypothetical protein
MIFLLINLKKNQKTYVKEIYKNHLRKFKEKSTSYQSTLSELRNNICVNMNMHLTPTAEED